MQQHIHGNGNYQAGRDLFVGGGGPQFSPNNPHAVRCPQCGHITGRFSEYCECGFRVKAHFDALIRERTRNKLRGFGLSGMGLSAGLFHIAQHWLAHSSFSLTINITAFGALLTAAACFKVSGDF